MPDSPLRPPTIVVKHLTEADKEAIFAAAPNLPVASVKDTYTFYAGAPCD